MTFIGSAPTLNPSNKSGMVRLCWCCCNKKAHVLTVSRGPGDTSPSWTAESDRLICPSQERSPCEIKDWARKSRQQTQIRAKPMIKHKTQTSWQIHNRLSLWGLNVRWGFITTHLLSGLGTENNSLWWWSDCWALTPRQAAVTWQTLSRAQLLMVAEWRADSGSACQSAFTWPGPTVH